MPARLATSQRDPIESGESSRTARATYTDFDLAIQPDPSFADAYIDRGIVFYRMHEFDRAFADIAQAKRIGNSNRTKTSLPAPHKASPGSVEASAPALS